MRAHDFLVHQLHVPSDLPLVVRRFDGDVGSFPTGRPRDTF
jgi:hypothetical protein